MASAGRAGGRAGSSETGPGLYGAPALDLGRMMGYSIKGLLFELIPSAAADAGGKYPVFSQRDLYYKIRGRYLNHPARPFHREHMLKRKGEESDAQYAARREEARRTRAPIAYKYFTIDILRDYEDEHGKIPGMIRETYGKFVEPHTGESLELGTEEVAGYSFPEHRFDKILLIEKLTERPKFEYDRIAEKYDMAIVYTRGYATEALHELLEAAEDGDYQIFVWHDADLDGYNICRNIRAATKRMPVSVEVIDIGLTVEEALRIGCASEPFTDGDALPGELRETLTAVELEYFEERQIRFEINGIDADSRIAYVEEQLRVHGIRPKYVPPEDDLRTLADDDLRIDIALRVDMAIDAAVDKYAIVTMVTEALWDRLRIDDPTALVRQSFEDDPYKPWSEVVDVEHRARTRKAKEEVVELVREAIVTMVTGEEE